MKKLLPLLALVLLVAPARGGLAGGQPTALVTAETLNQLLAVDLPCGEGAVVRRLAMPADPENVVADGFVAVIVSARGGAVTLVDIARLRVLSILHGFVSPHLAVITADNRYAYVTDDGAGRLAVIDLARRRVVRRIVVGSGAHHLALGPGRLWVVLGERSSTIVVLDVSNEGMPRILARIHPATAMHSLAFTPFGDRVWITSDSSSFVTVVDASTYRRVATIPAGSPPQHVAFASFPRLQRAFVTSGNDGVLRVLDPRNGRLLRLVHVPLGSYNVETGGSFVLTSSLTLGTLTELDGRGRLVGQCSVAPAARDAALVAR